MMISNYRLAAAQDLTSTSDINYDLERKPVGRYDIDLSTKQIMYINIDIKGGPVSDNDNDIYNCS